MSSLEQFKNKFWPHRNQLYRFALRMVNNVQEAEDIVQDVFSKIWVGKEDLVGITNPEAWCMRMTKNLSLDRIKSSYYKQSKNQAESVDVSSDLGTPDKKTEMNENISLVEHCVASLPSKQQQIIQLRDIEGFTYEEISKIMEIPMNQVKVNLHRARKTVKETLIKQHNYGL